MRETTDDVKPRKNASTEVDNSLRGAALRRATRKSVPKTLTPYEWEQWYAKNGVPPEHRKSVGWIKRLLSRLRTALSGKPVKP